MNSFSKIFVRGLVIVLPVSMTIIVFLWAVRSLEGIFGTILIKIMGEENYIPGTGLVLTLLFIYLVGILGTNYITKQLVSMITDKFSKFPLVKTVYNPLKDLVALFGSGGGHEQLKRVVIVEIKENFHMIGLVTRDNFADIESLADRTELVSVYFPLSYMFGGYTLLVNRSQVKEIDLPVDQALKLSITGWIKSQSSNN